MGVQTHLQHFSPSEQFQLAATLMWLKHKLDISWTIILVAVKQTKVPNPLFTGRPMEAWLILPPHLLNIIKNTTPARSLYGKLFHDDECVTES